MIIKVVSALVPLAVAWVGKLLVDTVVEASAHGRPEDAQRALFLVGAELALMLLSGLLTRSSGLLRSLLGARLAYQIQGQILEKAQTLDLVHFETPEVYDKLQNARREASSRPLNLFINSVDIASNAITLASYGALLFGFSPWTLLILLAATVPSFVGEARFSGEAFRLFTWRAPEGRKMRYLEMLLTRDSNAPEVKLYGLGPLLLERYRAFYRRFFAEDRRLAVRRAVWGFALGVLSTAALYGCYAWIVVRTVAGALTLGDMTLYVTVFRQGQASLRSIFKGLGSGYEDNLFMSNLFGFLSMPTGPQAVRALFDADDKEAALAPKPSETGRTEHREDADKADVQTNEVRAEHRDELGYVLENVGFRYPGTDKWALKSVDLTIGPKEKLAIVGDNGAGKSTLIKLLTGLYPVSHGQIRLDGVPINEISEADLRARLGVVTQDFVQYEFTARENVGLGQPDRMDDIEAIRLAARRGGAFDV
ncbi:MAG: ABC transporter ATP-binding protein, partial [Myxococcota bacterium]